MALKIKRGSEGDRVLYTPEAGEPLYTTDTKKLYIGDGTTPGGLLINSDFLADTSPQLGGDLDTNGNDIIGTGSIDITGNITTTGNLTVGQIIADVKGSLFADDSTIMVDAVSGIVTADVIGNVTGDLTGNVTGNVTGTVTGTLVGSMTGDVKGSVFADDSTIIVDAIDSVITADTVNTRIITSPGDSLVIDAGLDISLNPVGEVFLSDRSRLTSTDDRSVLILDRTQSSGLLPDEDTIGDIVFALNDTGGSYAPFSLSTCRSYLAIFPKESATPDFTKFLQVYKTGKVQINGEAGGTGFDGMSREPDASFEVYGNVKISGASELLLGNMTTAQRDALTPANGMMLYNTTDNKFQGYENGAWVNLI